MKSNELFERIHSGEIKENTRIEVKTEDGNHIAYITYNNKKLNWIAGEFDTRYLCDIETEFETVRWPWEMEELHLEGKLTGEKINLMAEKINEIVYRLNKMEEIPF